MSIEEFVFAPLSFHSAQLTFTIKKSHILFMNGLNRIVSKKYKELVMSGGLYCPNMIKEDVDIDWLRNSYNRIGHNAEDSPN